MSGEQRIRVKQEVIDKLMGVEQEALQTMYLQVLVENSKLTPASDKMQREYMDKQLRTIEAVASARGFAIGQRLMENKVEEFVFGGNLVNTTDLISAGHRVGSFVFRGEDGILRANIDNPEYFKDSRNPRWIQGAEWEKLPAELREKLFEELRGLSVEERMELMTNDILNETGVSTYEERFQSLLEKESVTLEVVPEVVEKKGIETEILASGPNPVRDVILKRSAGSEADKLNFDFWRGQQEIVEARKKDVKENEPIVKTLGQLIEQDGMIQARVGEMPTNEILYYQSYVKGNYSDDKMHGARTLNTLRQQRDALLEQPVTKEEFEKFGISSSAEQVSRINAQIFALENVLREQNFDNRTSAVANDNEEVSVGREKALLSFSPNETLGDWGVNNVAENLIPERSDYIPVGEREPRLNSFQMYELSHSPRFSYSAGRFPGNPSEVVFEDGFIWTSASDYKVEKKDEESTSFREAIRESDMYRGFIERGDSEDFAYGFCAKIVKNYPDEAKRRGLLVPDTIIETEEELEAA